MQASPLKYKLAGPRHLPSGTEAGAIDGRAATRKKPKDGSTPRKLRRYINAYSANAQPIRRKYSDVRHRIRNYDLAATGQLRADRPGPAKAG
jgi:hypothetical protein